MATLRLYSFPAESSNGFLTVKIGIGPGMVNKTFPEREVEIRTTADALAALAAYKADAAASGLPLAVTMRLAKGHRAPRGFRAAAVPHYHSVNL